MARYADFTPFEYHYRKSEAGRVRAARAFFPQCLLECFVEGSSWRLPTAALGSREETAARLYHW